MSQNKCLLGATNEFVPDKQTDRQTSPRLLFYASSVDYLGKHESVVEIHSSPDDSLPRCTTCTSSTRTPTSTSYIIQIIHRHLFFVYHMYACRRGIKINRVNWWLGLAP
jgi:hypothetical protein